MFLITCSCNNPFPFYFFFPTMLNQPFLKPFFHFIRIGFIVIVATASNNETTFNDFAVRCNQYAELQFNSKKKVKKKDHSRNDKNNLHTLKTLAASGSFSKSISKGSISTSIRSCSKSKSMSLSFSKDERGGAPLDNKNIFNTAMQAH